MIDLNLYRKIQENFEEYLKKKNLEINIDKSDYLKLFNVAGSAAQSYLFEASPAVSADFARVFFVLKNCPGMMCERCELCELVFSKSHPDCIFVAPEGSEIVRKQVVDEVIRFATETPVLANRKLIVIEEAHLLNMEASNALLKILEEPPASTIFILATDRPEKLLPTIESRLARVKLNSQIEEKKDQVIYYLLKELVLALSDRKGLHNLDKKLKEVMENYARRETDFLKEKIDYLSRVDFDPKLKRKLIALENQKYERTKRKFEVSLLFSLFLKLKKIITMVLEYKNGGISFLNSSPSDLEIFDILKYQDEEVIQELLKISEEALEFIMAEVKPDYVLKAAILKSWMVVNR